MDKRFDTFTALIQNISRLIRKIKTAEVAEYKLRSSHVCCLYYLYKNNGMTAKELCDACCEDKGAMSRSIDFLEKNGFLSCKTVSAKRYNSPLTLTEKGIVTAKGISEKVDTVLKSSSSGITENDLAVMYNALAKVEENLRSICGKEKVIN